MTAESTDREAGASERGKVRTASRRRRPDAPRKAKDFFREVLECGFSNVGSFDREAPDGTDLRREVFYHPKGILVVASRSFLSPDELGDAELHFMVPPRIKNPWISKLPGKYVELKNGEKAVLKSVTISTEKMSALVKNIFDRSSLVETWPDCGRGLYILISFISPSEWDKSRKFNVADKNVYMEALFESRMMKISQETRRKIGFKSKIGPNERKAIISEAKRALFGYELQFNKGSFSEYLEKIMKFLNFIIFYFSRSIGLAIRSTLFSFGCAFLYIIVLCFIRYDNLGNLDFINIYAITKTALVSSSIFGFFWGAVKTFRYFVDDRVLSPKDGRIDTFKMAVRAFWPKPPQVGQQGPNRRKREREYFFPVNAYLSPSDIAAFGPVRIDAKMEDSKRRRNANSGLSSEIRRIKKT